MSGTFEIIAFFVGAVVALVGAGALLFAKSPMRGALYLLTTLCGLALLYIVLAAPFVAAMQILVYAGGVLVLFIFVIMLLNLGPDARGRPAYLAVSKVLGGVAIIMLCVKAAQSALALLGGTAAKAVPADFGSVKGVGTLLLTDYLFAFEAVSALLLVAIVGAVVLGMKRLT